MARLAEMDGHTVVGGADTLGKAARPTRGLLPLSGSSCLHGIGSFLSGGRFDVVVAGYHLLCFFVFLQSRDFG